MSAAVDYDLRTRVIRRAYADLACEECRCGAPKGARKSLCWRCWLKLDAKTKRSLYDRERYVRNYLWALKELNLIDPDKYDRAIAALGG